MAISLWPDPAVAADTETPDGERMVVIAQGGEAETRETRRVLEADAPGLGEGLSAADILRDAPSAHIQTNSRGETLVFLRNAGERQVALFYDGALLNVPWDNRFDLSFLPAGAVGAAEIVAGPTSVQYGLNTSGGVVNLTPPRTGEDTARLALEAGTGGLLGAKATLAREFGAVSVLGSAGIARQDGDPLPEDAGLAFSQQPGELRTNTDRRQRFALGRVNADLDGAGQVAFTLLHAASDRGIAPESDRDPETSSVRFWRLPETELLMGIASGSADLSDTTYVQGVLWGQSFGQTIDSFASAAYAVLDDRQIDEDRTYGARVILRQALGEDALLVSLNALQSTHEQQDIAFGPEGEAREPVQTYRQRAVSIGIEYEMRLGDTLFGFAGAGLDWLSQPLTGDKPAFEDLVDYSAIGGLSWQPEGPWSLRLSAGRKVRFPTPRELFGTAINRFRLNPDLGPETSLLAELAVGWSGDRLTIEAVPFIAFTTDTIDQQTIVVDGRSLRERINLDGSRVMGVDVIARASLLETLFVEGNVTASRVRRRGVADGETRQIAEKPEVLGRVSLVWEPARDLSVRFEGAHRGRAFSADPEGVLQPLPTATTLDAELRYRVDVSQARGQGVWLSLRADNLTNEAVVPQAGLPAPGRRVRAGIDMRF